MGLLAGGEAATAAQLEDETAEGARKRRSAVTTPQRGAEEAMRLARFNFFFFSLGLFQNERVGFSVKHGVVLRILRLRLYRDVGGRFDRSPSISTLVGQEDHG